MSAVEYRRIGSEVDSRETRLSAAFSEEGQPLGRASGAHRPCGERSRAMSHVPPRISTTDFSETRTQTTRKVCTHNDVVTAGLVEHVGDELGGDGRARLVLLVLAGVEEVGDDGGDAARRRDAARVDHDAELHERGVDGAGALVVSTPPSEARREGGAAAQRGETRAHYQMRDEGATRCALGPKPLEPL